MTQDTPIALVSRFESSARRDFEKRLEEARLRTMGLLTRGTPQNPEFDAREAMRLLMTITTQERYTLLNRVLRNVDGPESLDGMESLNSFVANYLLDDSECMVVPEPFDPEAPGCSTLLSLRALDEDCEGLDPTALEAKVRAEYEAGDRNLVVMPHVEGVARVARGAEIVRAIRHNRDKENRLATSYREAYGDDYDDLPEILPAL